ncbi:MAG TPA: universal stress protein, partial [Polyangiaceae bacterium]|nr:universal stress protein [Polyangiaceae bacterium]
MTDYERILVPVDFSTHSGEATRVAADLAKRFNSSLTLVYVYDPLAYSLPDGFAMLAKADMDRLFEAFRTQLAASRQQAFDAGATRVDTKLLTGFVANEIVEFASRGQFSLIVMGTHGRTGMLHLAMGSIAERV